MLSAKRYWDLRMGNLKWETDLLFIVTKKNSIRAKHIKVKIDKTRKDNKYRLCGDEKWDRIIRELRSKKKIMWLSRKRNLMKIVQTVVIWICRTIVYAFRHLQLGRAMLFTRSRIILCIPNIRRKYHSNFPQEILLCRTASCMDVSLQ